MKQRASNKNPQVYQFKIFLEKITPTIWRRIQVPEHYTFWDLHVAIQDSMGWQDYHLHEFRIVNPATGNKDRIGIPDEESFMDNPPTRPGWTLPITDYFTKENAAAEYVYDYGDYWLHQVVLEDILPQKKSSRYPVCVEGERACPPEDCGGTWGYEEFLASISDPDHEEHDSMLEWIGGSFDPEYFHPAKVKFDDPKKRWAFAFKEYE
jgi:Plasmid pRiA4b ORF-3-like protein